MVLVKIDKNTELYPYGILGQAAQVVTPESEHWVGGFDVEFTRGGISVSLTANPCTPRVAEEVVPATASSVSDIETFTVTSTLTCSTMGNPNSQGTRDHLSKRLTKLLMADIQYAIEREFWNIIPTHPNTATVPVSTLADPTDNFKNTIIAGLALAEEQVSSVVPGLTGTIHMNPRVASVTRVRPPHTTTGSNVIIGQGYSASGIAVTGSVTVLLGDSVIRGGNASQRIDTATNTITLTVDTPAAIVWDSSRSAFVTLI